MPHGSNESPLLRRLPVTEPLERIRSSDQPTRSSRPIEHRGAFVIAQLRGTLFRVFEETLNLPGGGPVLQWMAQKYVKDLSKVTLRGQMSHSATGAWCGGTPPFGFDLLYFDSSGKPYHRVRWLESGDKEIYSVGGELVRVVPRGERVNSATKDVAKLVASTDGRIAIVRRIFSEYAELGHGFRAVADGLNRAGVPSPRDGNWSPNARSKWSTSTIREIVRNPAYRGDTTWNRRSFGKFHAVRDGVAEPRSRLDASKPRDNHEADWIVVRGTHEPLVPLSMFDRAQSLTKARREKRPDLGYRQGSGLRSPFLLSGLVTCGRCGQRYQGRTVNSTKHRKDGTKIKTFYYACGGWVMKGASCCEKFFLRKEPLEAVLLDAVRDRLASLLGGGGEEILRTYIEDELGAQGKAPGREVAQVRARLAEIEQKANVLLEGMSAETRSFVDAKLRDLAQERQRLQERLDALRSADRAAIDPELVLRDGLASLRNMSRLMNAASLEERKELIHAFISGVTVRPDEARLDVMVAQIPALAAKSSVGVVAGARYEPVQIEMKPVGRFLASLRRVA